MFPPELWNVRGISRQLVNRTNNPLERYNRELNNELTTQRPNWQTSSVSLSGTPTIM
ncbi:hypothetical protein PC123_g24318 [Phytophthora cactorum]|nr:hypothetical protein PC123_g24318 [Phytophthora cactorum]